MKTHNAKNERIKRAYLIHLKEAHGRSENLLDQVAKAIDRYESYTRDRDLDSFNIEQVKAFKQSLSETRAVRSNEPLSHATIHSTLMALESFFRWLAGQKQFRSRFSFGDWDYFNPARSTVSIAKARRMTEAPTIDEVRITVEGMPFSTDIERRDRALVAFVILTRARDQAVASFRLRHIDIKRRVVFQDARVVKTKLRKTFETWFFPVGNDFEQIVIDWVLLLTEEKGWGPDDPLFPRTLVALGSSGRFEPVGLDRRPWMSIGLEHWL
jgi:site-specific recombinase XerD